MVRLCELWVFGGVKFHRSYPNSTFWAKNSIIRFFRRRRTFYYFSTFQKMQFSKQKILIFANFLNFFEKNTMKTGFPCFGTHILIRIANISLLTNYLCIYELYEIRLTENYDMNSILLSKMFNCVNIHSIIYGIFTRWRTKLNESLQKYSKNGT